MLYPLSYKGVHVILASCDHACHSRRPYFFEAFFSAASSASSRMICSSFFTPMPLTSASTVLRIGRAFRKS